MKLGIILLHWKNKSLSLKLLNQLLSWNLKDTLLILVQNETTQDNFSEISKPNLIKLYSNKNKGFGGGMNIGLQELNKYSIEYTLLLNPDVEIKQEVVEQLMKHLQNHPNTFAVGPRIIETFNGNTKTYVGGKNIARFINTRLEENPLTPQLEILSVDYVIGAAILINHHHLKKTGYFDEDFFFSGEVAELCYRAIKKNLICETLLNCSVNHQLDESTLRNTMYKYYNFRNRFLFIRKHPDQHKHLTKWYLIILKELIYNLLSLNWQGLRTSITIINDVLFKIKGNCNYKFLK